MKLSADQIEFLRTTACGQMDDQALQSWWKRHYEQLRQSVPIWLLLRFRHGGQLAAQATLDELQIAPSTTIGPRATGTKSEWLTSTDPTLVLGCLRETADARSLRLFAIECCRSRLRLLTREWQEGIEVAQRACDGRASEADCRLTFDALTTHFREVIESDNGEIYAAKEAVLATFDPNPFCAAVVASAAALSSVFDETEDMDDLIDEERWQTDIIREIFAMPQLSDG